MNDKQLGEMTSKRNKFGGTSVALEMTVMAMGLNPWFQFLAFLPAIIGVAAGAQNAAKC